MMRTVSKMMAAALQLQPSPQHSRKTFIFAHYSNNSIVCTRRDTAIAGTVVRNSSIPEELGRISFLLTDKTGQSQARADTHALAGQLIIMQAH
jgi:hypothetical protein